MREHRSGMGAVIFVVLRGRLWPTNALLPVSRHVFDVEAWPAQVTFEEDPSGAIRALRWSDPRVEDGPAGVYARVAT